MKKIISILSLGFFALASLNVQAGDGKFSAGAEVALPMGDFGDAAGLGLGLSLRYELPVADKISVMATAGYVSFGKETIEISGLAKTEYSYSIIPVQLGAKYYFNEIMNGFYGSGEIGVHSLNGKFKATSLGITTDNSDSNTGLSYAIGAGYHLSKIDIGVRYQLFTLSTTSTNTDFFGNTITVKATSTESYLGIRAAFVF
ncbi:MAG: hypothetical protein RIQ89_1719 [Bacteroidota bacterium]|jgi:hypothetical protein